MKRRSSAYRTISRARARGGNAVFPRGVIMHHANASRPRQKASHRVTAELLPTVSGVCNERSEAVDQGPKTQVGRKCDFPSPEKSLNEDQSLTGNDAREEIERD
jgi:hypothetical protein